MERTGATERDSFLERIDAAHARLEELSRKPSGGLTEPEPETGERWEAGQVWAHIAEFSGYWVTQLKSILTSSSVTPPFGRTVTDPTRLGAIDQGLREPAAALIGRALEGIEAARSYLAGLSETEWSRSGRHAVRGVMGIAQIVERFVAGHLEEHAAQLESLAKEESAPQGG